MGVCIPAATSARRQAPAFAAPAAVGRRPAPASDHRARGGIDGGVSPRLAGPLRRQRWRRALFVASSSAPPPPPFTPPQSAGAAAPSAIPLTSRRGLPAVAAGAALLLALGINRVAFTPPPPIAANPRGPTAPSPEARSDLLGVAAAATAILHGLASADVVARETAVELGGVALPAQSVGPAFGPPAAAVGGSGGLGLATWAATAITTAIPSVVSVAAVVGGRLVFWAGLFPPAAASEAAAGAAAGGDARADGGGDDGGGSCGSGGGGVLGSPVGSDIVARAVASRTRAYLADTKSVPRADAEFRWLPRGTPAVVVVPFGGGYGGGGGGGAAGGGAAGGGAAAGALVLAASRTRPLTGVDFGWLQALADRLGEAVESAGEGGGGGVSG